MEYYNMLLPLAIILIVSKLLAKACTKFNLPTVVGLLITGLLMSLIRYIPGQTILDATALDGIGFLAKIGVILIMLFMIAVYRVPGVVADLALCIYILVVFYALALVPGVQLTLPGIAGILLGLALGAGLSKAVGYAARPSLTAIVVAVGFSMAIGVFFGYYPANKAAKLDPIEALRYE